MHKNQYSKLFLATVINLILSINLVQAAAHFTHEGLPALVAGFELAYKRSEEGFPQGVGPAYGLKGYRVSGPSSIVPAPKAQVDTKPVRVVLSGKNATNFTPVQPTISLSAAMAAGCAASVSIYAKSPSPFSVTDVREDEGLKLVNKQNCEIGKPVYSQISLPQKDIAEPVVVTQVSIIPLSVLSSERQAELRYVAQQAQQRKQAVDAYLELMAN